MINWIPFSIQIFVQGQRILVVAFLSVHTPKAARGNIQVPRAVVIEIQVGVELFTCEEIVVRSRAGGVEQGAEGVVVVGVRRRSSCVRQRSHAAVAFVI